MISHMLKKKKNENDNEIIHGKEKAKIQLKPLKNLPHIQPYLQPSKISNKS